MDKPEVVLPTLECLRCGHTWHPRRSQLPTCCPKCGSPYWDKPRREKAPQEATS